MNRPFLLLLAGLSFSLSSLGGLPVQAQRVVDVTPGINSRNVSPETSISGVFENSQTESVKPGSVSIFLNGQNITRDSTITRSFFSYRPGRSLSPGNYTVRVDYESTGGQLRSVSWAFNVEPEATLDIAQVTHNAAEGLGAGGTLVVTVNGTRDSQAAVVLVENGRVVREIQAQETSPGLYTAALPVNADGSLREGIVIGRLMRQDRTVYGVASRPALFTRIAAAAPTTEIQTGTPATSSPTVSGSPGTTSGTTAGTIAAPIAPRVTSHGDGDRISTRGFTLVGETSPNATVKAVVTASTPVFGVFSVESNGLVDREIEADSSGRFELPVPSPTLLQRDTRYTIELTSQLQGQTSTTTTLELRQR